MVGVVLLPVAIQRQRLAGGFVHAQDVGADALIKIQKRVDLKDRPQAVFIVAGGLAALDLVIGDAGLGELRIIRVAKIHINIHASTNTPLILHLGDVLNVRLALG